MDATRAEFMAHCAEHHIDAHFQHGPRQIKITYRGQDYEITASSCKQSFERLSYAFIIFVGVDASLIPKLWCESDLIKRRPPSTVTIEPSLIKAQIVVRNQAMVMTSDETITSELIRQIIEKRHTLMCTVDEHWPVIEGYWESIITSGYNSRFNTEIIECLPHASTPLHPRNQFENSSISKMER